MPASSRQFEMTTEDAQQTSRTFALDVKTDDAGTWPPASAECLPFEKHAQGLRLLVAPLFVGGLSVGDVIDCEVDEVSQLVFDWNHVSKSDHTTIWLLGISDSAVLLDGLERLRGLDCSTSSQDQFGVHSIDVPGEVSMEAVDVILDELEASGVMVACPSFRHPE